MTPLFPEQMRAWPVLVIALATTLGCGPKAPVNVAFDVPEEALSAGSPAPSESVRWILARDPGTADVWHEAVGAPVVLPAPDAATTGPLDSLAVVTWNTHVGGGALIRFVEDLRAGALTDGVPVPHFVLLLQEVHREGGAVPPTVPEGAKAASSIRLSPPGGLRLDIEEAAGRLDLSLFYVPSMRNGPETGPWSSEDRGNAILSTLPLEDLVAVELPLERQRRVAVGATITAESSAGVPWQLDLVSLHLDTRCSFGRLFGSFERGRLRQARFLTHVMPAGSAAVVGGDLNTWFKGSGESSVRHLQEHFPFPERVASEATFRLGPVARQMDYLFFRVGEGWGTRQQRVDHKYGSDHYPLLGWVRFGAELEDVMVADAS